jgi:hypothetical protein
LRSALENTIQVRSTRSRLRIHLNEVIYKKETYRRSTVGWASMTSTVDRRAGWDLLDRRLYGRCNGGTAGIKNVANSGREQLTGITNLDRR